ncbi:uncharacterized protein LOC130580104 isoform X2 [Malurus melanocephalus]|uniref:uncharacterized protein LOC130580104 isoform X2 n=1 Tax=Malurus melanocephalus TaxID=175006 RepID=UPI002547F02A|nr:uncharacterized protein LOC130580104 isoform X2 [Malurus melanocephalus]
MPSLPQDGVGGGFPTVMGPPSELRGFYVTTYEAAYGQRPSGSPRKYEVGRVMGVEPPSESSVRPLHGNPTGSGYVVNNFSELSSFIFPHLERQDTDVSTTAEDFRVFGRPIFQRILPQSIDEQDSRYPTDFSLSRLRFEEMRPPKTSEEYSTECQCACAAQPDAPQRTMELSGFTGTAPRSDLALPEQPLDTNGDRMDFLPSTCSAPQPAMGCPAAFAPPELRVGPKGVTAEKEPLTFAAIQNQYLTELSPMAPIEPGWWTQDPITWAPRSVEGVQPPRPSGFSTNNHPTSLWHTNDRLM